jgi:transposase InsO family protein
MWLMLLLTKDKAREAFMTFQAWVKAEAGKKVGTLCTDHDGEFTTHDFLEKYVKHGIQCHLTAPYTLEQNGVIERRNQSVMVAMARIMLKAMSMSVYFWGEAVTIVVYILNRLPTQSVDGQTPY